jgi:hypothetical protein
VTAALGPGAFTAGALLLALTLGCAAGAATLVAVRRLPTLTGAPRAVAVGLLFLGATLAAMLVPLALGVLTRATPAIVAALLLLAATRLRPAAASAPAALQEPAPAHPRSAPGSWLLAGIALAATATAWLAWLEVAATEPVTSVDALSFHLPGVIGFIQTGSLWHTTQYLPGQAQGNYPQFGDVLMLALALPWHSLAFVRYADPPLLVLAGLAVYATGRELRAPAPTALLAALAFVSIRPTLGPALPDVLTDPAFLAGFGGGTLFLLRHQRTGARGDLVLAGLGLGLALGSKWYGLSAVPALLLVTAVLGRRRGLARLAGLTVLCGGIWMVRNLVLTGNPVFDYKVSLLGATIFAAPPNPLRTRIGFTLAHYAGHPSVLRRYVWPVFRSDFGVTGAVIALGALVTAIRERRDRRVLILAVAAALAALAYAFTPYSAQGFEGAPVLVAANTRYGAPALLLATPLLAVAVGRLRVLRPLLELVLLVCVLANLHRYLPSSAGRLALSAVALFALVRVVQVAAGGMRSGRPGIRRPARVAVLAALTVGLGGAVLAYHYQRVLAMRPLLPDETTVDYVLGHDPDRTRIALAGTWTAQGLVPVTPLFGPRLGNRVTYLGPFVAHRLAQYTSAAPFVSALRRGRFELLEIGTGFPPAPTPRELTWARAAGYSVVAASPRLILMRAPDANA